MLNLYGPMNQLGYGIFFNGLISHLIHMTDCTIVPIGAVQLPKIEKKLQEAIERQDSFQFDAPSVCLFHEYMLNTFTGKPMIGFPIFETTKLRPRGLHMMKQLDFNWVPSTWAQKICIDHGIDNTHVVPGGVNPTIFNPDVKPCTPFINPNVFTIVNIGKFEERKGHKVIVEILQERFANKDIRLLASWTNNFIPNFMENLSQGFQQRGWIQDKSIINRMVWRYKRLIIELIPPQGAQETLASIMKCGNMGLYPTKAEGWCLPAMESIACGVPTAVTNYSAPVDFINDTNSRPIKSFEMVPAQDGIFFKGDVGDWAVPDKDEIAQAIQDGLDGKIPTAGKEFGEKWSWKNSALKAKHILIETGVIPEEAWNADTIREETSVPITGPTTGPAITVEGSPRNDKPGVPSGEDNGGIDAGEDESHEESVPGGAGDPSEASL